MIFHENKVWLHNTKCGGTFFRNLLSSYDIYPWTFWEAPKRLGYDKGCPTHTTMLELLEEKGMWDAEKHGFPKTYTIVRNPVTRFASGINTMIHLQKPELFKRESIGVYLFVQFAAKHWAKDPAVVVQYVIDNPSLLQANMTCWIWEQCNWIKRKHTKLFQFESPDDWVSLVGYFAGRVFDKSQWRPSETKADLGHEYEQLIRKLYRRDYEYIRECSGIYY